MVKFVCLAVDATFEYVCLSDIFQLATLCTYCCFHMHSADVKDYYGERIGLYFAYMGFYCTGLMPVAALGAGAFVSKWEPNFCISVVDSVLFFIFISNTLVYQFLFF